MSRSGGTRGEPARAGLSARHSLGSPTAAEDARTWRLRSPDGTCAGELRWVQDSHRRDRTGWWLHVADEEESQRLRIEPEIDRLAADLATSEHLWVERADAARSLTVATALTVAESRLDLCDTVGPGPRGLPTRSYEIYVDGADVDSLGRAFPGLATEQSGRTVRLTGRLDDAQLVGTLRRLRSLGCRVAGYVAMSDHR